MTAGYSGTPLAKKLSLKDGLRTWWDGMPESVRCEIEQALALDHLAAPEAPVEAAHLFVTRRADLEDKVRRLLPRLAPTGFVWVSWPKKASKVETDITEDVIREVVLPARPGRRQGLRSRSDLVGPEARHQEEAASGEMKLLRISRISYIHPFMVVCVCNAIRERDVRTAARNGASCPSSAYAALGRRPRCGQCFSFARQLIAAEQSQA